MTSTCQYELDDLLSTFYNPDPSLSMQAKSMMISGILANVTAETQELLNDFIYRIDNGESIAESEWKSVSNCITTDLALKANERERSLHGRAKGDLLEEPFVPSLMRQYNDRGYIEVKLLPNIGNNAGFDIYCINPQSRKAVIIELKNWSPTTTMHEKNVGDNYLVKRLIRIIDGIGITVVCEILVMFGGHIASTVQQRFSSEGVIVLHDKERIRPDYSLSEGQRIAQIERIESAAKKALDIVEQVLGLKQATALDLSTTLYKLNSDGSTTRSRVIQSPTFNDEYITIPFEFKEIKSLDPSLTRTIEADSTELSVDFTVSILKTLLSKALY